MEQAIFLDKILPSGGFGLEVGPSHQPRFPRSAGHNVEVLDHATADELREKYRSSGVDISKIEDVDYVSDGGALHDVVPRRGEYDFVFSNHVLEHIPDIAGYFKSCELLLKPGGLAIVTVPDKRYIFDALQNSSTTGEVLEAYHDKRTRHRAAVAFDFSANMVTMDGSQAWLRGHAGTTRFIDDLGRAMEHYEGTRNSGGYRDYHGWRFTPRQLPLGYAGFV